MSSNAANFLRIIFLIGISLWGAAGCGQTGPLYLPPHEEKSHE